MQFPAEEFERSIKSLLRVRYAVSWEEDVKVGFEDNNEKDGENDECADPHDNFEGLPLVEDGTTGKMIFVFQSHNMKRLYQRYGKRLVLLDVTYKTTKPALPLYFLAVQTNVNYQVRWHQVEIFTEL